MDSSTILDQLRDEHDLDCSPIRMLEGLNEGTTLLLASTGEQLVLKVWRHRSLQWAMQANKAIDVARRAGWPSPPWRLKGETSQGLTFSVQERAAGNPVAQIDEALASSIVETNRYQHGHATPASELFDYSKRVGHILFDDLNGWKSRLIAHSDAADQLVQTVMSRVDTSFRFDSDDLVHGDYSRMNLLADGGSIAALVDVDNLGWGNRALDLTDAYRQMVTLDDPPAALRIIRREIEDVVSAEGFYAGFAFWTIANLAWAIEAKPEYVSGRIAKLWTFVNSDEF